MVESQVYYRRFDPPVPVEGLGLGVPIVQCHVSQRLSGLAMFRRLTCCVVGAATIEGHGGFSGDH